MPDGVDDKFYERADAHIHLSNEQLEDIDRVRASASMMYATARFNAWVSARGFGIKEEMAASREETIDYFLNEYRLMLEENFDDYVEHFAKYMMPPTSAPPFPLAQRDGNPERPITAPQGAGST